MTKQEKIVKQRKQILLVTIIVLVAVIGILGFSISSKADESKKVYKYYTSYEVQPGDTLWTIADNYLTPENNDKAAYINEIKRINHLLDDDITSGQYIVVAYYSYDML